MPRLHSPGARRAFTLVELLAVIAIVGVLCVIIFIGMRMARQRGEAAACLSNMRAVGQAVLLSTADNRGRFPALVAGPDYGAWADVVRPYLGSGPSKLTMCCPAQRQTILALNGKSSVEELNGNQIRNFAFNSDFGPNQNPGSSWRTVASINNPSRTMMLSEAGISPASPYSTINDLNEYWLLQSTLDESRNLRLGIHYGGNNIVWCDGHATRWENIRRLFASPYRRGDPQDAWSGR
ncbi:MAG TPA: type II secretion system protein [Rariglobus sp.]